MATSSKFGISSDGPDRPMYSIGQRGSHIAAQLDMSSSFRESTGIPILSSLPNASKNSSVVTQGNVLNFFQWLRLDPKVVAADHKSNRQGDFKRQINVTLGVSSDNSSSGSLKSKVLSSPLPDEIKRLKASLRESCVKARGRVEIFNERLSVFNKFFPHIPSKKRSRSESFSSDQSNALSSDLSGLGPSLNKMGMQNLVASGTFKREHQKLEKRTKNVVPNKRTRSSLVDARDNALVQSSGTSGKDREMLRLANNGVLQGDDQTVSIGVDGWKKTKMKKKRSGIKLDVSPSPLSTKLGNGYEEAKHVMQERHATDARSRLHSRGLRPGVSNAVVGVETSDGISQPSSLTVHSSIPKAHLNNNSPLNDRKERPGGSDKKRVKPRAVNKSNVRDDFHSASPTTSIKINSSIRATRSSSGIALKLSPAVHRENAPTDWELSHCANKSPTAGVRNRKREESVQSTSAPVAHWAGQRPQKISRTARRTNLIPVVSNNDESPALDTVSDISGNETGMESARCLTGISPQQVKLKGDLFSAALSESEESGATKIKSKDKCRKPNLMDEKAIQNVRKVSNLGMSSRKIKLPAGEDLGDGIRKGRSGRGFASTRSMPMSLEKLANVGTAKQLRSARLGFDKAASQSGRLLTRKVSDRKAYIRQKHVSDNAAADFLVASDDGHKELLVAASSVINPAYALSSSFWKQMEPLFRFISDTDIAYIKLQRNLKSAGQVPSSVPSNEHNCITPSRYGWVECEREEKNAIETKGFQLFPAGLIHPARDVSLCQRLLAAIISEEDHTCGNVELESNAYGNQFELDGELGTNGISHLHNFLLSGQDAFNGHKATGNQEHDAEFHIFGVPNDSNFIHFMDGILSDQKGKLTVACSQGQYDEMSINEKLLLEVQSIRIMPDKQIEDEGINGEISKLEDTWQVQVSKRNCWLDKLLKCASEINKIQEKEFEQHAHDKLVAMAYKKYMASWGPNATAGKGSSNKIAKQAALTLVKQTLDRCHKFEETGNSCFNEPLFKDIFLYGSAQLSGAQSHDSSVDGEHTKLYTHNSSRPLGARFSASLSSQPSPQTSWLGQNGGSSIGNSCDLLPTTNHLVEQMTGKEDTWSNGVKKRELLLDDIGGTVGTSSSFPSGIGGSLSSSMKGKRSERDREGKGHSREVISRIGINQIGLPALYNAKEERKPKTKAKQKTTQLSVSVNGLFGKPEQPTTAFPLDAKSSEITCKNNARETDGSGVELEDPIDLSHLQLPGIDVLDDTQEQDLGSWLNIDDDGLQDHDDFMGLEIPMDDLSDLNMMV